MNMRRIMSALVLAFAAGLSAACGADADEAANGPTSTSTGAAAASPSVDVKADTERICKNVVAAFDNDKIKWVEVLLKLATEDDPAARDQAKADGVALVGRFKTVVDKETANAADPKVKAALQNLVSTMGTMLTPEAAADPEFETKLDAAIAEAGTYCPALNT